MQSDPITPVKPAGLSTDAPQIADTAVANRIVQHVMERIKLADNSRRARNAIMRKIDMQLFSQPHSKNPTEDRQPGAFEDKSEADRLYDLEHGFSVKPVNRNFGFAAAHMESLETFIMSLFAPDMSLFEGISMASQQTQTLAIANELNSEGKKVGHYTSLFRFVRAALRYNFSAMSVFWETHQGMLLEAGAGGIVQSVPGVCWEGNNILPHDPYNFFYDTSVDPVKLNSEGEYYAWVEPLTLHRARCLERDKRMFWVSRLENCRGLPTNSWGGVPYYDPPPETREMQDYTSNLMEKFGFSASEAYESKPTYEVIHFVGFVDSSVVSTQSQKKSNTLHDYQLWRFDIVNCQYLVNAVRLQNPHGMLPVVCCVPEVDITSRRLPGKAEQILPLSQYGSFLLNSDMTATRKALGGITLFDQTALPLGKLPEGDMIGAKIPIRPTTAGQTLDSVFKQLVDVPETAQNYQKLSAVLDLMQKFAPTDFNKQMADLDRATRFQAAAVQQGGNRENLLIARVIYEQAMNPLSIMMVNNVMVNKTQLPYLDQSTKTVQMVPVASLIGTSAEYDIGTGLRGIDRMILLNTYFELLNYINQNQQAIQRIDIVKLLNYVSTLSGDHADLSQFELSDADYAKFMQAAQEKQSATSNGGTV